MKEILEEFEEMDLEMIFELVESETVTCYEYYIDGCFDVNYQEVLDKEIEREKYIEIENRILEFVNELREISDVRGVTCISTDSIKENFTANNSTDYIKRIELLEKEGKINVKVNFSVNEVEVASIIALRGIGQTMFMFRKYELIIFLSDLHGMLLFYNDNNVKYIIEIAKRHGLVTSKI